MRVSLSESDTLLGYIQNFRAQIAEGWNDIDELALTDKERAALRLYLTLFMDDLISLMKRLNEADNADRP
jgi:hypothetical protein